MSDSSSAERPVTNSDDYPLRLHMPGILKLLSEHLYTDPRVAVRELIQNAYDSCQRRQAEADESGYSPRIDIMTRPEHRQLIIEDNGSGLTEDEIHRYLSTVGRGYTVELRERLVVATHDTAQQLIGQFGLGVLSAFLVASRLTLETQSVQPGNTAYRWRSAGEATYTLEPTKRAEPGSRFMLDLSLDGEFLLNEHLLRDLVKIFADFLPVPIYVNAGSSPVNNRSAPWLERPAPAEYVEFIADRFGIQNPLAVVPLHDHSETIALPGGGEDVLITPLRGVLYVPPESVLSVMEYGEVLVTVRRMFITAHERQLLPRWARFVHGIVESPALNPTASRESVRRDDVFYAIQQAIESQLLDFFQNLAGEQPGQWRQIVRAHRDLIKVWALESPAFFEAVADLMTFDTSKGPHTLPQVLESGDNTVHYLTHNQGAAQQKMLYEARDALVVDASHFAEEAFLQHYADLHPDATLSPLTPEAPFLFEPVPDPERFRPITRYYTDQGIDVRVVNFVPPDVVALVMPIPEEAEDADARQLLEEDTVDEPLAFLVNEYLRRKPGEDEYAQGILYLNASAPLVHRLLELDTGSKQFSAALEIVYQNARLFAGLTASGDEARRSFELITHSLAQLVDSADSAIDEMRGDRS